MQWYDWLIVIIPTVFVLGMGIYSRRYLRDVTTFLSSGRVCGRYVISVGDVASSMAIITLLSYVEIHYKTGFATAFWTSLMLPLGVVLSLFGYVTYRFRETKSQSIGQFLEMRYSRKFRIFAAALRSISEMLANMIMPALSARFFIYFMDLPQQFTVCGLTISTFHAIMILVLTMAISIICMGGSMAIIITDTIQGFFCYPMLVFFTVFVLVKFPWNTEMMPVMADRAAGESFLDAFDIARLKDFNIFSLVMVPVVVTILQRASWIGAGSSSTAARSPHEQKMATLLGTWRGALGSIFYVLVAVALLTFLNHHNYAKEAHKVRIELTSKVAQEVVKDKELQAQVIASVKALPPSDHIVGKSPKLSDKSNIDTRYLDASKAPMVAKDRDEGNATFQKFRALYYQLMLPMTMKNMLPAGVIGLFALLMVLLMLSTDDSRIFSAAITIGQDVILPLRKKPFTPKQHMWMIRWVSIGIGVFFFLGSSFMSQLDYIQMFIVMMTNFWLGGCGPVLIFGLYSRFGTTAGAWTSLLAGMGMALFDSIMRNNWAKNVYPWLEDHNCLAGVKSFLTTVSKPFVPYVDWSTVVQDKYPINGYEWYFLTMMVTLILYCVVSKLTCKEPFNLDRMLHRGKYSVDGQREIKSAWTWKSVFGKLIGITPEYSTGDKFIAWCYFVYSFIYRFFMTFILVLIWNAITPWDINYWSWYFLIVLLIVPGSMAAITAVWFGIGGAVDLVRMFRDLEKRTINELDDGRVEGNVSLADKAQFAEVEKEDSAAEK